MNIRHAFLLMVFLKTVIASSQVIISNDPVFGFAYAQENNDPYPVVTSVTMGSPANLAHLDRGDHLITINGVSLHNLPADRLDAALKNTPQLNNVIAVQHADGTSNDITINKADYITSSFKEFRYTIFFDQNKQPIFNEGENCIWATEECQNGYGYYVYDQYGAFNGEFENNNRKQGLYYHPVFGKPTYYLGGFVNNDYEGDGILQFITDDSTTRIFKGTFHNGAPTGQGEIRAEDGALVYSGGFNGWKFEGQGKYIAADGTVKEGLWTDGQFADDIIMPSTETPDNTGYTAEEIAKADKCRKAGLTEKEIRNFLMELRQPYSSEISNTTSSTVTMSGIDNETSVWNEVMANYGYKLIEEFDVGFSINEIGSCFTSCSTGPRRIMLLIPQVYGLQISDLYVITSRLSGDISDVNYDHFPFELVSNEGAYQVYNCNIIASEIHSGCSYQWEIQSEDGTRRFVRVLVYAIK